MINVRYIRRIQNCNSAIEVNSSLAIVEKQLSSMLQDKNIEYYKKSQSEIVVTLIVNPTDKDLIGSYQHSDYVYSILSQQLEGDAHLYSVRNRLGRIDIPKKINQLLIVIGLTEYFVNSEGSEDSEDNEKPAFYSKEPKWNFKDVILNEDTKQRIFRALSIIENKDIIFNKWGFSKIDKATKSILCFYGPAGTGKTMTAEAIGDYLHKTIVHSSYAEIESKWVGEGAKNLHAIFKFAEENDSVLFFDEADSFLSSRIENTESSSDKHYNRMSNELFQLLEEFNGCVIFSTNLLKDVDEAFKSRIIDSIRFNLPDVEKRTLLIRSMIPNEFPINKNNEEDLLALSKRIEGFSGRDIRKAMLLSLSGAAIKQKEKGIEIFSFSDIEEGFNEVLLYKEHMSAESGEIPTQVVSDLVQKQKLHENIIDIAIYAILSDGVIQEQEIELLNQLSMAFFGVPVNEPIETPSKSLETICEETKEAIDKKAIIETAVRVVCIDGKLEETEREFICKLNSLLGIQCEQSKNIIDYAEKLTNLNKDWSSMDFDCK